MARQTRLVIGQAGMFDNAKRRSEGFAEILVDDLACLDETGRAAVLVIDVREPHEWTGDLGHIGMARLVPLDDCVSHGPGDGVGRDDTIVVVCRSGQRSATATMSLAQRGFNAVFNLAGGMIAWNDAGHPVEYDD